MGDVGPYPVLVEVALLLAVPEDAVGEPGLEGLVLCLVEIVSGALEVAVGAAEPGLVPESANPVAAACEPSLDPES